MSSLPTDDRQIELYIEELILEGFELSDRYIVSDALARELERLLRQEGFAPRADVTALKLDRLDAGSITVQPGTSKAALGARLGRAVFDSLSAPTAQRSPGESSRSDTGSPRQPLQAADRST